MRKRLHKKKLKAYRERFFATPFKCAEIIPLDLDHLWVPYFIDPVPKVVTIGVPAEITRA